MMNIRDYAPPRPQDRQSFHKYKKLYILKWICVIVTSLLVSSAAVVVIVHIVLADKADVLSIINQVTTNISSRLSDVQEKFDNLEEIVSRVEDDVRARSDLKLCSHGNGCRLTSSYKVRTHCYKVFRNKTTWADARKKCQSFGGFLAEFHDYVSLEYVQRVVAPSPSRLWIGASDEGREGNWTWVTSNKRLMVDDWDRNQPDNDKNIEHCLETNKRYQGNYWNDMPCNFLLGYICQRDGDHCEDWLKKT